MTLTIKTAKHAVGKYGEIFDIVDDENDLTPYSMTREEVIEANKLEYEFTPCIVVTTAREALDAAWELAYEPEDGVIPPATKYIRRECEGGILSLSRLANAISAKDPHGERRLLDSPEPEPEPWEESDYCFANGNFYKRLRHVYAPFWRRVGSETTYFKETMTKLDPRPVTIEGEDE